MNEQSPATGLDLQRFQALLFKKGHGSVKRGLNSQQSKAARARRLEMARHGLAWPNCTAEIRGYSIDSKGQRYAVYTNGRLERVPSVRPWVEAPPKVFLRISQKTVDGAFLF